MACDYKYWEVCPDSKPDEIIEGHFSDQTQAGLNLGKIGQTTESDFNAYLGMALNLFGKPEIWLSVEALVSDLIAHRTLQGESLAKIAAGVPRVGEDFWNLLDIARRAKLQL